MLSSEPRSYAVIDVETTGARPGRGTVIEVGIVIVERGEITAKWSSLVDPGVPLPRFIVGLTGINDEMLRKAPPFSAVAETIRELLKEKIAVAHNASFDRSYISAELVDRLPSNPWVCTVKMSRALLPGHPSYSLSKICASAGVERGQHHRALSDAEMTARLLLKLLRQPGGEEWVTGVILGGRNKWRAEQISRDQIDALPDSPGILYWHGERGEILSLRKCESIRGTAERMVSQGGWTKSWRARVREISGEAYGSLLVAAIVERIELLLHRPVGNTPPVLSASEAPVVRNGYAVSSLGADGARDVVVVKNGVPVGWFRLDRNDAIESVEEERAMNRFDALRRLGSDAGLAGLLAGLIRRNRLLVFEK